VGVGPWLAHLHRKPHHSIHHSISCTCNCDTTALISGWPTHLFTHGWCWLRCMATACCPAMTSLTSCPIFSHAGLVLAALYGDRLHKMVSHAGMAGGPNTSELL